ncbi:MAG: TIGR00282 family metallophosphoesterase [Candidatus Syntrophonatronum acetioxidans]|uniref:TIGR00282 family metallophosphoesterase n=1 Tax=Candidatus Syntrophonatronum acetioxidans TaxID=1795816 RepID=A0A424YE21_9FIRM|nr:MAG: TIGR00282 family metallophosphoesterase [Candidatus Syntrophonatronum acetioxidans]
MKILMIGDVVGRTGRDCLRDLLAKIKENYEIDLVIANGENAAGGRGITRKVADDLFSYGVDILTSGNHVWDNKEIMEFIDQEERILRPVNYPPNTPGIGYKILWIKEIPVGIINVMGKVFLSSLDCPFRTLEKVVKELRETTPNIIVDFHAEATSEKIAMGWFLDGQVSAVLGTHTHVQTADERIFPQGTAFICDVGMTGPVNGVIGVKKEAIIKMFLTQLPTKFEFLQESTSQFNGVIVEIDPAKGKAESIFRLVDYHKI